MVAPRVLEHVVPAACLALVVGACSGDSSGAASAGWTTSIDTVDGVPRVVNAPPAQGAGPGYEVVEDLRIGSFDNDDATTFGELRGLAVTDDGLVAVLDAQAHEIRVFDRSGVHVATHGREGEGPGEYVGPTGVLLRPDGRLWVPDPTSARMSVVDVREGFIESAPHGLMRRGFVYGGAVMADGRLVKPSLTLGPPRRDMLRVFDPDMAQIDTIPQPDPPELDPRDPPVSFFWEAPGGMPQGYIGIPFAARSTRIYHPSGVVWSTEMLAQQHRLTAETWTGETLRVVETRRPPVPIPPSVRDTAIDRIRETLAEVRGDIGGQSWDKVPQRYPFVERMTTARNGDLWVETGTAQNSLWDVFDTDGRHLRAVRIDWRIPAWIPPVIVGDEVWAIETDDLDVPYIVRGRITEVGSTPDDGGD